MVTDQKHSSDSAQFQRDQVIRRTEKTAQIFGLDKQNAELKKRVKPLEECVKWLDDNVDKLFIMKYCNCSKESINTSSESSSSEEFEETITVLEEFEEFDSDHALPKKKVDPGKIICAKRKSDNKYLPDLKHASGINDIWEREVNLERLKRVILTDFQFRIDIGANANFISEKIVKIAYAKDNSIPRVYGFLDESYSTLGKVNLRIILNDGEKHKIIPTEFIVTGPDWPDQFPEILLGSPWMQENNTAYIIYGTFRCYKFTGTIGVDSIFPSVHLDLNFSTGFGDKILNRIAETYSNLKYLNLQKSRYETDNAGLVTDKGLCAIARSCHKLEYLNISYHRDIFGISICEIIHSCPRLQHLKFSYCEVTFEIIKEIAGLCLNLKYLKVEGCDIVIKEVID
ncbi:hypothetical protein C1646_753968 [Rhizophagus diaphanus]|nr:hypothetical protein C1646_753968 [Rhizophagus diaphanus] [Rhizophagus sp. MUCL 43196]